MTRMRSGHNNFVTKSSQGGAKQTAAGSKNLSRKLIWTNVPCIANWLPWLYIGYFPSWDVFHQKEELTNPQKIFPTNWTLLSTVHKLLSAPQNIEKPQWITTMDNNGQKCTTMDNKGQKWTTMDNNPRCYMHLWCRFSSSLKKCLGWRILFMVLLMVREYFMPALFPALDTRKDTGWRH